MTDKLTSTATEKRQLYSELASQAMGLLADEPDLIATTRGFLEPSAPTAE